MALEPLSARTILNVLEPNCAELQPDRSAASDKAIMQRVVSIAEDWFPVRHPDPRMPRPERLLGHPSAALPHDKPPQEGQRTWDLARAMHHPNFSATFGTA